MWELTKIFAGTMTIGALAILKWILIAAFWSLGLAACAVVIYGVTVDIIKRFKKIIN